ncbi:hypothetical protein BG004_004179 [Podila humilis]|nr:hypothetical protein BG004_004179 [Podila humilis]
MMFTKTSRSIVDVATFRNPTMLQRYATCVYETKASRRRHHCRYRYVHTKSPKSTSPFPKEKTPRLNSKLSSAFGEFWTSLLAKLSLTATTAPSTGLAEADVAGVTKKEPTISRTFDVGMPESVEVHERMCPPIDTR